MTNFDFLKDDPQFSGFADAAIAAERILPIDAATAVLDCRRAMEFAVKWMYSVDSSLVKPWDDKLISLMSTEEFHDIVDDDLWRRMDFIRKRGNDAAHGSRSISREQAELCLENLFLFLDFVAYCYGTSYQEKKFDASLLTQQPAAPVAQPALPDVDLDALIKENAELKAQLTARRETQQPTYVPSRWNFRNTRPGNCISTPCSPMPGGSRAKTGSTRSLCPGCPTRAASAMQIMSCTAMMAVRWL